MKKIKRNKLNFLKAKSYKLQANRGFLTLMGALIVAAVGLSVTVSLLMLGLAATRTSFAIEQSYQASSLANSCAEEVLQQIYTTMNVTPPTPSPTGPINISGNLTLTLQVGPPLVQGTCTYTATGTYGSTVTIQSTGTVGTVVRKNLLSINSAIPFTVTSWQEVADF